MQSLYKIGLFIAVFAITTTTALAQVNQQQVNISANVQAAINTTLVSDVSFGNIGASSMPVIDPNGTNSDVGSTATIGEITVTTGTSTQNVIINWDQTTVTLGDGSGNTLSFTPDVDINNTGTGGAGASTDYTEGTAIATSGAGGLNIYIGGNLGTLSGQATGSYSSAAGNGSGDLTVTVIYQ